MSEGSGRPRRGGTARLSEEDSGRGETRRTERLSAGGDEWSQREPVNAGWRSERATGARRGKSGLPVSPQEFQLWLQAGGWRYVAGIAALLVVMLIALLAYGRNDQRETGLGLDDRRAPTSVVGVGGSLTPAALLSVTSMPTQPPTPKFFTVVGTGAFGLNLRTDHNSEAGIINFYNDGTRLERIGEDFKGPDRVWRKVRAPDGQEGWVAAEFLTPAP
jgi:hypothetical protein